MKFNAKAECSLAALRGTQRTAEPLQNSQWHFIIIEWDLKSGQELHGGIQFDTLRMLSATIDGPLGM